MSNKEMKIDFSGNRMLSLASDLIDEGNLIDALKLINDNDDRNGISALSLNLRANVYDDLYLYDMSINTHLKLLAYIDKRDDYPGMDLITETYSDLVALFESIDDEFAAKTYYGKLVIFKEGKQVEEVVDKITDEELFAPQKPVFADVKDEMDRLERIDEHIYNGRIDSALEELLKIKPTDKSYLQQKVMLGHCYIMKKQYEKAIECVKEVIKRHPADIDAGCILVQAYVMTDKKEEAQKEVLRLISKEPDTDQRIMRVAYAACDCGMDKEAYDLFRQLDREEAYDLRVRYFYAVSAYNSGRYNRCSEILKEILTVHNKSETAKYLARQINEKISKRVEREVLPRLEYNFELPPEEVDIYHDSLSNYKEYRDELAQKSIEECLNFYSETIGLEDNSIIIFDLIDILDRKYKDDLLEDLLLNTRLNFIYQNEIVRRLVLRDEDIEIGYSRFRVYSYLKISRLNIGSRCRKSFLNLYSDMVARVNLMYENCIPDFKAAVEALYIIMEKNKDFSSCRKSKLMFCAALYLAAEKGGIAALIFPVIESQYEIEREDILKVLHRSQDTLSKVSLNKRSILKDLSFINEEMYEAAFADEEWQANEKEADENSSGIDIKSLLDKMESTDSLPEGEEPDSEDMIELTKSQIEELIEELNKRNADKKDGHSDFDPNSDKDKN